MRRKIHRYFFKKKERETENNCSDGVGGAADKIWKKRNGRVVKLSPINKSGGLGRQNGKNMMQNTRATNGEYIFQLCKYGRNKLIYIVNKGLIKGERRQKSEKVL